MPLFLLMLYADQLSILSLYTHYVSQRLLYATRAVHRNFPQPDVFLFLMQSTGTSTFFY
jgi:hypothetical protein